MNYSIFKGNFREFQKRALCSVSVVALLATSVSAQDESENNGGDDNIEEIIIMGAGEVRSSHKLTIEAIERQAPVTDALSMLDRLPGVNVGSGDAFGGDDWTSSFSIRGFGLNQMGVVVDDFPLGQTNYGGGTKPNRFIESENLSSVELQQGASDTGTPSTQALAGSISYTSRKPSEEFGLHTTFTGGSNNMRRGFLRVDTGEIADTNTFAYVSYSDTKYDHWMDYGADAEYSRKHLEVDLLHKFEGGGSLEFRYILNDRHANNYDSVSVEEWRENPWDDGIHGPWTNNTDSSKGGTMGYNAQGWGDPRKDDLFTVKGEFTLGEFDVKALAYKHTQEGQGYWPWQCIYENDGPMSPTAGPSVCDTDAEGRANLATQYISNYANDRRGATLNISREYAGHEISFGGWYQDQLRTPFRTYHDVIDPAAGPEWNEDVVWYEQQDEFHSKTIMAFVEDKISLMDDRLTVLVGAQLQQTDIDYTDLRWGGENSYDGGFFLAPRFGMVFNANDNTEIFASFTRNFSNVVDYQVKNYVEGVKNEAANSFDFGVRYRTDWLTMSLTGYHIKFNDRITYVGYSIDPEESGSRAYNTDGLYINTGEQSVSGGELGVLANLTDEIDLYVSASRLIGDDISLSDAETDLQGNVISTTYEDIKNKDFSIFSELSYRTDEFGIAVNAAYEDAREGNWDGAESAPSYLLFGLYANYNFSVANVENIGLRLNVHNLFDRAYLSGVAKQGNFYVGAPRTVTLTLDLRF